MTDESGYLRYKCDCGALIKVDTSEPRIDLHRALEGKCASAITHECDPNRLGIAKLIGCTFSDDSTKYCSPITK